MSALIAFTVAALLKTGSVVQENPSNEAVTASLTKVKKGTTFDVVYTINPDQGWHLYWINPGDTGQGPTVEWSLPKGVTVDGPYFPIPDMFKDETGVSFIYNTSLPLVYHFTVGDDFSGQSLRVDGQSTFLICHTKCLPITGRFFFEMPVGDKNVPSDDASQVADAVKSLPKTLDPSTITLAKTGKTVALAWKVEKTAVPNPAFWPANESTFDLGDLTWNYDAGQWHTIVKLQDGAETPKEVKGLLMDGGNKSSAQFFSKSL